MRACLIMVCCVALYGEAVQGVKYFGETMWLTWLLKAHKVHVGTAGKGIESHTPLKSSRLIVLWPLKPKAEGVKVRCKMHDIAVPLAKGTFASWKGLTFHDSSTV